MTQRNDVRRAPDHAQDILNRWCVLAEQRLDFLIELYESGRWRRYHSENAFLENLREAKTVVEVWRMLARREAMPDDRGVDRSRHTRPSKTSPAIHDDTGKSPAEAAVTHAAPAIAGLQEDTPPRANKDVPVRGKAA